MKIKWNYGSMIAYLEVSSSWSSSLSSPLDIPPWSSSSSSLKKLKLQFGFSVCY